MTLLLWANRSVSRRQRGRDVAPVQPHVKQTDMQRVVKAEDARLPAPEMACC
jgi:hypothetical protein